MSSLTREVLVVPMTRLMSTVEIFSIYSLLNPLDSSFS